MKRKCFLKNNSGRSILELLVVMAVIALLSIIILKSFKKVVSKAQADGQQRQIAMIVKETQQKIMGSSVPNIEKIKMNDAEFTVGKGKTGPAKDYFGVKVKVTDKSICEELTKAIFVSPALITVNGEKEGTCPGDVVFYFPKDPSNTVPLANGDESVFVAENSAESSSGSGSASGANSGSGSVDGENGPNPSNYNNDPEECFGNNFVYCSNGACVSNANECPNPEDYNTDEEACKDAGFNWCSGASTSGCQADCCANVSLSQCQASCDSVTGAMTLATDGTLCDYSTEGANDGVCQAGECVEKIEGKRCADNSQCGGMNSGYFCNYNGNVNCEEGRLMVVLGRCRLCEEGILPSGASSEGYFRSKERLDWFSAKNFCESYNNGHMVHLNDIGVGTVSGRYLSVPVGQSFCGGETECGLTHEGDSGGLTQGQKWSAIQIKFGNDYSAWVADLSPSGASSSCWFHYVEFEALNAFVSDGGSGTYFYTALCKY